MPKAITLDDVPALLRPAMGVYIPGVSGESTLIAQALRARPEAAAGVRFVGVWLPGINSIDYAGLHADARATAFFVCPALAASFAAGRIDYHPLSYSQIFAYLRNECPIDLAFLQVSPPDHRGLCSVGIANDFAPAVLARRPRLAAHINPRMPRTVGAAEVAIGELDWVIEADAPLLGEESAKDEVFMAIGRQIAPLITDGATLEIGVGRVQGVLDALSEKQALRLHTGAITDAALRLVEAGAIAEDSDAITTGMAFGSPSLYRFVAENPRVRFAGVGWTHDPATLRAIEGFVAINSVIEVDLLGQANAEMIDGRQVSSAGGISDFMRGARLSPGGFSVIALPATARGGSVSKIVAQLAPGTAVSVTRSDIDVVATEFGIADLRNRSLDDRAHALIAIAAPPFRQPLKTAWQKRRAQM
jgi:acyl-CoA hydrolase